MINKCSSNNKIEGNRNNWDFCIPPGMEEDEIC
jgi:hypothetical protein